MKLQKTKAYFLDLGERVAAAAVEGFLGALTLNYTDILSVSYWKAAAFAGASAGFAVIKGAIAGKVGNKQTAAMLPGAAGGAIGGAAGAAVGSTVGSAVGGIVESVGHAVEDIIGHDREPTDKEPT